jgi:rhodanese-related sulfurtransferase
MTKHFNKTAKEIATLLGISIIIAFSVNYFSPKGIALIGQWKESQGVITAKAKDDIVFNEWEIEDVKIAKQIFDSGKAIFVDARSLLNFEDGHIKGATSLPVGQFDLIIEKFKQNYKRSQPIVTYCSGRTCDDSHRLAQLLFEHGFDNISVFIDGYPGWEAEGYPIEK